MSRDILFAQAAARDFGRLTVTARRQVQEGLTAFAASRSGAFKTLPGVKSGADLCRLRVGEYRIVFDDQGPLVRVCGIYRREP